MQPCVRRRSLTGGSKRVATRKIWKRKRGADLAEDLDILLAQLCVEMGFCNRLKGSDLLSDCGSITAQRFATAVIAAGGLHPVAHDDWLGRISGRFFDRYGSAISERDFSRDEQQG
jgi:hypothetical protein